MGGASSALLSRHALQNVQNDEDGFPFTMFLGMQHHSIHVGLGLSRIDPSMLGVIATVQVGSPVKRRHKAIDGIADIDENGSKVVLLKFGIAFLLARWKRIIDSPVIHT